MSDSSLFAQFGANSGYIREMYGRYLQDPRLVDDAWVRFFRASGLTAERTDGSRRTTRYDIDLTKCIFCGFCEEACPVDAIVQTRIFEYHGEARGDLYYTKQMLLAVGDKNEAQIAADRAQDAPYR